MTEQIQTGRATHGVSLVRGEPFASERYKITKGAIGALRPLFPEESPETVLDTVVDQLKNYLKQNPREVERVIKLVIPAKWDELEALVRIDKRSVVPSKFELTPSSDLVSELIEYLKAKRDNKLPDFDPTRLVHAWAKWLWQTGNSAVESWDFQNKLPEHVKETKFKRSISALGFTFANSLHKALEVIYSPGEKSLETLRERVGFIMECHRLQEFLGKEDVRGFVKHIAGNKLAAIDDPRRFRIALYYDQRSTCIEIAKSLVPDLRYFFEYDNNWLDNNRGNEGLKNVLTYETHQKINETLGEFSPKESTLRRLFLENRTAHPDCIHIVYSKNAKDVRRMQSVVDSLATDLFHDFATVITGSVSKRDRTERLAQLKPGSAIITTGVAFPEGTTFPAKKVIFYCYSAHPKKLTEYPWVQELRALGIDVHQIPIHKTNTTDTATRARR